MSEPTDKPLFLKCGECDHDNEPQRVFCHNCGAKLDRSVLPRGEDAFNPHYVPPDSKKRVAELMNANRGWLWRETKKLCKCMGLAILVAVLYLVLQKPANIPPPKGEMIPDQDAKQAWDDAMMGIGPATIALKEDAMIEYMKKMVKGRQTIPTLELKRAYCRLYPTFVDVTAERTLFGYFVYNSVGIKAKMEQDKLKTEVVSMRIGRMGLHPKLGDLAKWLMGDVLGDFERRHQKELPRIVAIAHSPETLTVSVKPGQ